MNDESGTVYISGPDGTVLEFANEAEIAAYRRSVRAAEPPLLRCLRKHRDAVVVLQQQAARALAQPRGRTAALAHLECQLRGLRNAMAEDVTTAKEKVAVRAAFLEATE